MIDGIPVRIPLYPHCIDVLIKTEIFQARNAQEKTGLSHDCPIQTPHFTHYIYLYILYFRDISMMLPWYFHDILKNIWKHHFKIMKASIPSS